MDDEEEEKEGEEEGEEVFFLLGTQLVFLTWKDVPFNSEKFP